MAAVVLPLIGVGSTGFFATGVGAALAGAVNIATSPGATIVPTVGRWS